MSLTVRIVVQKLREATYTATVCKFLLFFLFSCATADIVIDVDGLTMFCLHGAHRPRPL